VIVLASDDGRATNRVSAFYYSYFAKTYKGAVFYGNPANTQQPTALTIKKGGEVVGVMQPLRDNDRSRTLAAATGRSAPAQAAPEQAANAPQDVMHNGVRIYPVNIQLSDGAAMTWAVETEGNKARREAIPFTRRWRTPRRKSTVRQHWPRRTLQAMPGRLRRLRRKRQLTLKRETLTASRMA